MHTGALRAIQETSRPSLALARDKRNQIFSAIGVHHLNTSLHPFEQRKLLHEQNSIESFSFILTLKN